MLMPLGLDLYTTTKLDHLLGNSHSDCGLVCTKIAALLLYLFTIYIYNATLRFVQQMACLEMS